MERIGAAADAAAAAAPFGHSIELQGELLDQGGEVAFGVTHCDSSAPNINVGEIYEQRVGAGEYTLQNES
jgi:hypothetical protein